MNKKKKILLIVAILLVILVSFFCGRAFAKYKAEVKGSGTAEIANWVFKVNGKEDQIQKIDLLSTYDNETLIDNKIAPGTSGKFDIILDATGSDVGVNYQVRFLNESEKPQNLIFVYDNNEYSTIQDLEQNLTGTIDANEENKTRTITIEWKWKYETGSTEEEINQNDIIDTETAKQIRNYTFDVNVIGIQVEPE